MAAQAPELLCTCLNHWVKQMPNATRLLRTLDGNLRAWLSNSYRVLDNVDFANAVLPVVSELGGEVRSADVTEDKMYLKLVNPKMSELILKPGAVMGEGHDSYDEVTAGLVLGNSEVGAGSMFLQFAIHFSGCTNLAVRRENTFRKTHLGQKMLGAAEGVEKYLTAETRRKRDEVVWDALRDVARAAFDGRIFHDTVKQLREKRNIPVAFGETSVQLAVQRLNSHHGIGEAEGEGVLDHLVRGGDLTAYGYQAAVTRYSQDIASYERASELERIGGDVITLPASKFKQIVSEPHRN